MWSPAAEGTIWAPLDPCRGFASKGGPRGKIQVAEPGTQAPRLDPQGTGRVSAEVIQHLKWLELVTFGGCEG